MQQSKFFREVIAMKINKKKSRAGKFNSAAELQRLKEMAVGPHSSTAKRNHRINKADPAMVEKLIELLEKIPRSEKRKYWGCPAWGMLISHATGWRVTKNEAQAVVEKLNLRIGTESRIPVSWLDLAKLREAAAELRWEVAG